MVNKEMLSVHLSEMKFVSDQMHTRMAIVARLTSLSAAFFTTIFVTFYFKYDEIIRATGISYVVIAFTPVIFLALSLLIWREQLLMVSHDRYFLHELRPLILKAANADDETFKDTGKDLRFLKSMSSFKIKGISAIVSAFSYGFPLLGISSIIFVSYERYSSGVPGVDYRLSGGMSVGAMVVLLSALVVIWLKKSEADAAPLV